MGKHRGLLIDNWAFLPSTYSNRTAVLSRAAFNPNGSVCAIEGITSPDGRIFGKMGHSERIGKNLYRNVPGEYDIRMFEAAVKYFK